MRRATSSGRFAKLLAVAASTLSMVCLAAQPPTFSVQALNNPPGTTAAGVSGINNAGEVVGAVSGSSDCPANCAVIWRDSTPTLLGAIEGATASGAYGVNNAGQVVGTIFMTEFIQQAVIWNDGTPTLLPAPGPQYNQTFSFSINDAGQVVGQAPGQVGSVEPVATLFDGSASTALGVVPGYTSGEAWGINSTGLVVGSVCCDAQAPEAAVWHGTNATLLPRLKASRGAGGVALAVNNSGLVVGHASAASLQHAVAWANGVVTDLGALGSGSHSSATAVNNRGIIVGGATVDTGQLHAVLWSRIGAKTDDLNTLISPTAAAEITLTGATGINDHCAIVANGYIKKTLAARAFVLRLIDASSCLRGL